MSAREQQPNSAGLYSVLLFLYPRSFRRQYGDEMRLAYRDLRRDEPARRVFTRIVRDAVTSVPRAQSEEGIMRTIGIVAGLVAVAVAVSGAVTGSFFVGTFVVIGVAVLVVGAAFLAARTGKRPAERDYVPPRWPWWSLLAGAFAIFEMLIGTGQLIHEPKKENVFALAVGLAFAGLFTGGVMLRRRGRVAGNWMIAAVGLPMLGVFWLVWPPILALVAMTGAISEVFRGTRPTPHLG